VSTPEFGPQLVSELERMANELFKGAPGGPGAGESLEHPGPSALAVGAGGASPAVVLPPVPGPLVQPPVANAPAPSESYLRSAPGAVLDGFGIGSPLAFAAAQPSSDTPYFLGLAGPPGVPASSPPVDVAAPGSTGVVDAASREFRPDLAPDLRTSSGVFDPKAARADFPILGERVHNRPLVWLDNAATTQKPRAVIERLDYFYEHENSNVHRAAHALAARATDAYEGARDKVRRFLNAPSSKNIVFVRGGTEAINLVAQSFGRRNVGEDDEIVITHLEHHANIVPWQQLAKEQGARLKVAPVDERGEVRLDEFERLLGPRTRLVAITHVSNALGTVVPVRVMTEIAHRYGARVLVDGAQAVSHMPVDVQAIDCDFYCFSGHKVFGPTGIGALFGKADVLDAMPPWQGGGNMISDVTFEKTTYQPPPWRFEAGTGNIADAVGLGAALDYVTAIGMETIERYEHELLVYATGKLLTVPGLTLIGTAPDKAGVLSFVVHGLRTEDIGSALDQEGIAVRSGHHCAQPILRRFGHESTVRASLALYNTCEDIDALVAALLRLTASASR
jgi:cysteine desulfurase / selenocysteine lyase